MRRFYINPWLFIVLLILSFSSCNQTKNKREILRLQEWLMLCDSMPEVVKDSLGTINSHKLSSEAKAMYGLLNTIIDDKSYGTFVSDSLINSVEQYYQHYSPESNNHVLSLIYQGIVRIRMGITDSTAYKPIKKAYKILKNQKAPDQSLLYYSNYYLGYLHKEANNHALAMNYYQQALTLAKKSKNTSLLFNAYMKIYWLLMAEERYDVAYHYLDSLAKFAHAPSNRAFLSNAQGIYDKMREGMGKGIQKEKTELLLISPIETKPEPYKISYSLSDLYSRANVLDSALYYANQSISLIKDSTYRLNYLLYENAADIAQKMQDYKLADDFRKQAVKSLHTSLTKRRNIDILELERRYNVAEAEIKHLKAESKLKYLVFLSFCGTLFTIIVILYFSRRRSLERLAQAKLTEEKNMTEIEKLQEQKKNKSLQAQAEKYILLLSQYESFLELHAKHYQEKISMTDKIRSKEPELGKLYDTMLKKEQQEYRKLIDSMFSNEEMQQYFNVRNDNGILTGSDWLLLFMLANKKNNDQIASLLNTKKNNLKTKKSILKNKILQNMTPENGFQRLYDLF